MIETNLLAQFVAFAKAGTLTPFSNNATICSYPFEGWTGGVPGSLGLAGLDSLIATTLTGQVVDIPTGVGFCMYIRRSCLDEVGLFDAERFGRGYGEENDFCRRAAATGQAKDIHEQDTGYLHRCYRAYAELAGRYGWSKVKCAAQGKPRSIGVIHTEVYQAVREIL